MEKIKLSSIYGRMGSKVVCAHCLNGCKILIEGDLQLDSIYWARIYDMEFNQIGQFALIADSPLQALDILLQYEL